MITSFLRKPRTRVGGFLFIALTSLTMLIPASDTAHAAKSPYLYPINRAASPSGARDLCQKYYWACSTGAIKASAQRPPLGLVKTINSRINRQTPEIADQIQYGVPEYWSMPTRRGGDCEDFALAKKRELIRHGIAPQNLLIATALDRGRNAHAVLIFRSAYGDLVLDNITNRILSWQDTGYIFLRMQDPHNPKKWLSVLSSG